MPYNVAMEHHACLVIAPHINSAKLPREFSSRSVDVDHYSVERLGIDDVRSIIAKAYHRPVHSLFRGIVIFSQRYSVEAQNALLKILEDPPHTTRFVLVAPHPNRLLPTVLSRLHQLSEDISMQRATDPLSEDTRNFINQSHAERLKSIASWSSLSDRVRAAEHMRRIIYEVGEWVRTQKLDKTLPEVRHVTSDVLAVYALPGASLKLLLDELALTIPVGHTKE